MRRFRSTRVRNRGNGADSRSIGRSPARTGRARTGGSAAAGGRELRASGTATRYVINLLRINGEQQVMLKRDRRRGQPFGGTQHRHEFQPCSNNWGITVVRQHHRQHHDRRRSPMAASTAESSLPGRFRHGRLAPTAQQRAHPGGRRVQQHARPSSTTASLGLAISALRDLNYAKSLAEPNLVTLNGQTATISGGRPIPGPGRDGQHAITACRGSTSFPTACS